MKKISFDVIREGRIVFTPDFFSLWTTKSIPNKWGVIRAIYSTSKEIVIIPTNGEAISFYNEDSLLLLDFLKRSEAMSSIGGIK